MTPECCQTVPDPTRSEFMDKMRTPTTSATTGICVVIATLASLTSAEVVMGDETLPNCTTQCQQREYYKQGSACWQLVLTDCAICSRGVSGGCWHPGVLQNHTCQEGLPVNRSRQCENCTARCIAVPPGTLVESSACTGGGDWGQQFTYYFCADPPSGG